MWIKYLVPAGLVFVAVIVLYYVMNLGQQNQGSLSSTQATFSEVNYVTTDGVKISADYYPGKGDDLGRAPVVILVHMLGKDRGSWSDFPGKLQEAGFAVLALDLRGHGKSIEQSGRKISYADFKTEDDWGKIDLDLHSTMDFLPALKVNLDRVYIIGASIGANGALIIAAETPPLRSVVLLSPGENYRGLKSYPAAAEYQGRKALVVSSSEDTQSFEPSKKIVEFIGSSATFVGLSGAGHGTEMLQNQPDLKQRIIDYLQAS